MRLPPTKTSISFIRRPARLSTTHGQLISAPSPSYEHLDLRNTIHIGHSTGGGEATCYVGNDPNVERYDPDLWTDEFAFLNQPGQADIQSDLLYDYRTNVNA